MPRSGWIGLGLMGMVVILGISYGCKSADSPVHAEAGLASPASSLKVEAVTSTGAVNLEYVTLDLMQDGIHDPQAPDIHLLQNPAQIMRQFPVGKRGVIDWVTALREGFIKPRAERNAEGRMEVLDLDILMTNTKTMPFVNFPHRAHSQWLACGNCHPEPFAMKAKTTMINMDAIFKGRLCGMCHGRVAFSVYICERCHSVAHENSPAQWW